MSRPAGDRILAKMYDFWTPIIFEENSQRTKTYIVALLSGAKPHSPMQSITLHVNAPTAKRYKLSGQHNSRKLGQETRDKE